MNYSFEILNIHHFRAAAINRILSKSVLQLKCLIQGPSSNAVLIGFSGGSYKFSIVNFILFQTRFWSQEKIWYSTYDWLQDLSQSFRAFFYYNFSQGP